MPEPALTDLDVEDVVVEHLDAQQLRGRLLHQHVQLLVPLRLQRLVRHLRPRLRATKTDCHRSSLGARSIGRHAARFIDEYTDDDEGAAQVSCSRIRGIGRRVSQLMRTY